MSIPPHKNVSTPIDENVKDNNTCINNTLNNTVNNTHTCENADAFHEYAPKEKVDTPKGITTPHQEIVSLFNTVCVSLSKVQLVNDGRKKAMRNLWKFAKGDMNVIKNIFTKVESSDFLCGRQGTWKASFDWILKQANVIKILEGNYDNTIANNTKPTGNTSGSIADRINTDAVRAFLSKGD